ncbi:ABC transporter ATP-binding protein [Alkalicoccobacillus porphyridii]|uniref:Carnitine transport ATP-binding protein OpuCA n=1 Tax=Alkalicoccobacillus porphyridii TaxID=2597270 RepID=A0A553ZW10_9BACI|nr:ABC transporter ATP-binding protein [Alkalicoccobacillus porphyridii]TSB45525.1 ABC transporter ATP-binding protein [Alkalicoccobacillus porphyridii]
MAQVVLKNIQKEFTKKDVPLTVLKDIDIEINRGEFVSLLGPSGCGKSTLLNLVAGLEKQTSGELTVNGNMIKGPGNDRIVVFQESGLFPWMNVINNVMYGLLIKKIPKAEAKQKAIEILKMVHLVQFQDSYPHELSGGMKQRVAIARALVMDPDILLMDEPFAALDEQTRMVLHRELESIWRKTGKTIIFVTHNIRESLMLSDRILLMGTRPGHIKKEYRVQATRPRDSADSVLVDLERRILRELELEMEKVLKEEMGDDYNYKEDHVSSHPHRNMGSDI